MLRLRLAAVGHEPGIERGGTFALPSNFTAVVMVVGGADTGRPDGPSYPLEDSAGSSSREGLD
jgi:hypothetical protein